MSADGIEIPAGLEWIVDQLPPPPPPLVGYAGTLLPPGGKPEAPKHECAPPMVEGAPPFPKTLAQPPALGSTWDCPKCGRVWVVETYQRGGTIFRPLSREWVRASWLVARRHRRWTSRR